MRKTPKTRTARALKGPISPRKARALRPSRNVLACVRGVGGRVRLTLPRSDAVLEVTVDLVRPEGLVGLVFALSNGLEFEGALDEELKVCPG